MLFRVNRPWAGGFTGLVQLSEMTASYQVSYSYRQHCRGSQGKFFVRILLSFMPKFEENQSVMNPNLVYLSLMYILCSMSFSGHLELN